MNKSLSVFLSDIWNAPVILKAEDCVEFESQSRLGLPARTLLWVCSRLIYLKYSGKRCDIGTDRLVIEF